MTKYGNGETGGNDGSGNKQNHGANGSVITMTLKNNHLIVETEERNVSRFSCFRICVCVCVCY